MMVILIDDISMVFRLQSIESANESLRLEAEKCKSALETARNEKVLLEQRVNDLNMGAQSFKEEIHLMEAELRKLKQIEKDNEEVSVLEYYLCLLVMYNIFVRCQCVPARFTE